MALRLCQAQRNEDEDQIVTNKALGGHASAADCSRGSSASPRREVTSRLMSHTRTRSLSIGALVLALLSILPAAQPASAQRPGLPSETPVFFLMVPRPLNSTLFPSMTPH